MGNRGHNGLLELSDRELRMISGETTHQHYKGGLYRLIGPVLDSETGGQLKNAQGRTVLLYEHVAPHKRQYWARSDLDWHEAVDTPEWHPAHGSAELIHRFRPLGQGWER